MAIYKPPPSRWRFALATGVIGLLIGLGIGAFFLGQADPDPTESIREIKTELVGVAGVLEVLEVEYRESVRDGEVENETEYQGAKDALARARTRFEEVSETLRAIDEDKVDEIDSQFDELGELIEERADADDVSSAIRRLTEALAELP
jgi:hypothetical protein